MPRVLLRKNMKLRIRQGQKAEVTIPKVLLNEIDFRADKLEKTRMIRGKFEIRPDTDEESNPLALFLEIDFGDY